MEAHERGDFSVSLAGKFTIRKHSGNEDLSGILSGETARTGTIRSLRTTFKIFLLKWATSSAVRDYRRASGFPAMKLFHFSNATLNEQGRMAYRGE